MIGDEDIDISREIRKLPNPFAEPGDSAAEYFRELTAASPTTTASSVTTTTTSTQPPIVTSGPATTSTSSSTSAKPSNWTTTKPTTLAPQIGTSRARATSAAPTKPPHGEGSETTTRALSDPTSETSRPNPKFKETPSKPVHAVKPSFTPRSPIAESPMKKPDKKQENINAYLIKSNRESAITSGSNAFPKYFDPNTYGANIKQLHARMDEIASDKKLAVEPNAFSDTVFFYCLSMATEEALPYAVSMVGTAVELKKMLYKPYRECTDAIQKKAVDNDYMKAETLDQLRLREQKLFKQQVQHAAYKIWPRESGAHFQQEMTPLLESELQKFVTFNSKDVNSGIFRLTTSEAVRAINSACAACNTVNAKAVADELIKLFTYPLSGAEQAAPFNAQADEARAKRAASALKDILNVLKKQQLPRELRWWLKEVNRLLGEIAAQKSGKGVTGDMKQEEFLEACKMLPIAQLFLNGGYSGISIAIANKGNQIDGTLAKAVWAGVMAVLNRASSGKGSEKGKWPKAFADAVDAQVPEMANFLKAVVDQAIAEKFD